MPKWFNVWNDIQRAQNKTKMLNQPVGRAGCAINLAKATGQNTRVLVFKSTVTWAARMKAENSAEKSKAQTRKGEKQWHEKCWKCQFVKSESEVCKDKLPWRQKKLLWNLLSLNQMNTLQAFHKMYASVICLKHPAFALFWPLQNRPGRMRRLRPDSRRTLQAWWYTTWCPAND